jgi:hypothetical protein
MKNVVLAGGGGGYGCVMTRKLIAVFFTSIPQTGGTRWRRCLRHCATSRKVAGSIYVVVIRIFY